MIWSLILNLPSTAAVLPSAILFTKIPDNSAKGININSIKVNNKKIRSSEMVTMATYITQTYLTTARHIQQWLFPGLCCPLPVQHQTLPHLCLPIQFKTSKCSICRHKELKFFYVYEIIKARVPEGLQRIISHYQNLSILCILCHSVT